MTQTPTEPNIGDRLLDGTVYAGTSPSTGKAMYTTPEDVGVVDVLDAEALIKKLNSTNAYGHNDWRVPDESEKRALLNAKAKGSLSYTFNDRHPGLGRPFALGALRTLFNLMLTNADLLAASLANGTGF